MWVGTAWEEITPDRPLALMGQMYVRMGEYARDPLTVNAIVFEDVSAEDQRRVAVVSIDVCLLPDALVRKLQQACAAATDIPAESVLIAATHTHVAPCTTDRIAGTPEPAFLQRLEAAAAQAVKRAVADLEPVELFAGRGYLEQMGWNRRGMRRDGSCHMYWGSWKEDFVGLEGPRDGEVGVLFAQQADGQVKAVVTSFATHPNCLEQGKFYSADIPGQVRRVLRGALGEHVGVVYLTGAAGNTAPSIMANNPENRQPWRGEMGVTRSGWYLGGEILKVMAQQIEPMPAPALRLEQTLVEIPMREWDAWADLSGFWEGMLRFFELSRDNWEQQMREENPVPVRLNVLRVGDAALCFNPAELYVEFGLAIKERSPARVTLIAELSDGYCGYVPIPEGIRHGGYSALSANHTRLVPEGGWIMVEETRRLLAQAFG